MGKRTTCIGTKINSEREDWKRDEEGESSSGERARGKGMYSSERAKKIIAHIDVLLYIYI